jgi:hypothetical protein
MRAAFQHALMWLWRRAHLAKSAVVLRTADYEMIGGVDQALSNHADEAFQRLSPPQQAIAEAMFRCLTERGPDGRETRRPALLREVAAVAGVPIEEVAAVVDVFRDPDLSLLTPPSLALAPDIVIDVSHESLIRQWRRLRDWVSAEFESAARYSRLEQTARLWRDGQASFLVEPELTVAAVWRETQKPNAHWAGRYGGDFDLAMRFLDKSLDEHKRKEHRDNVLGISILLVLLIILFAGILYIFNLASAVARLFGWGG